MISVKTTAAALSIAAIMGLGTWSVQPIDENGAKDPPETIISPENDPTGAKTLEKTILDLQKKVSTLETVLNELVKIAASAEAVEAEIARLDAKIAELDAKIGENPPNDPPNEPDTWQTMDVPGILSPNGGGNTTESNPYGLRGGIWRTPERYREFLQAAYARAAALYKPLGNKVRIIHHQPAGWNTYGMHGAVVTRHTMNGRTPGPNGGWIDLYPWRWDIFVEELANFLEEYPNAIVGIYFSANVPASIDTLDEEMSEPDEVYDHSERHRRLMIDGVVGPLAAIGISEFWFDNTSPPHKLAASLKLFGQIMDKFGVRGGLEAYPIHSDYSLDLDTLALVPALGIHRFNQTFSRNNNWVLPPADKSEILIALTGHSNFWTEAPTIEDAIFYAERGQVLIAVDPAQDDWLLQIYADQ